MKALLTTIVNEKPYEVLGDTIKNCIDPYLVQLNPTFSNFKSNYAYTFNGLNVKTTNISSYPLTNSLYINSEYTIAIRNPKRQPCIIYLKVGAEIKTINFTQGQEYKTLKFTNENTPYFLVDTFGQNVDLKIGLYEGTSVPSKFTLFKSKRYCDIPLRKVDLIKDKIEVTFKGFTFTKNVSQFVLGIDNLTDVTSDSTFTIMKFDTLTPIIENSQVSSNQFSFVSPTSFNGSQYECISYDGSTLLVKIFNSRLHTLTVSQYLINYPMTVLYCTTPSTSNIETTELVTLEGSNFRLGLNNCILDLTNDNYVKATKNNIINYISYNSITKVTDIRR